MHLNLSQVTPGADPTFSTSDDMTDERLGSSDAPGDRESESFGGTVRISCMTPNMSHRLGPAPENLRSYTIIIVHPRPKFANEVGVGRLDFEVVDSLPLLRPSRRADSQPAAGDLEDLAARLKFTGRRPAPFTNPEGVVPRRANRLLLPGVVDERDFEDRLVRRHDGAEDTLLRDLPGLFVLRPHDIARLEVFDGLGALRSEYERAGRETKGSPRPSREPTPVRISLECGFGRLLVVVFAEEGNIKSAFEIEVCQAAHLFGPERRPALAPR